MSDFRVCGYLLLGLWR